MENEKCPFCGLHPFEYVDIGVGMQACAVTCCNLGWYLYDGGSQNNHCGMPYEKVLKMKEEMKNRNDGEESNNERL